MKYEIDKSFGLYRYFRPPVTRGLLPAINAALSLFGTRECRRKAVNITKLTVRHDGVDVPLLLFEPDGLNAGSPCLFYIHGGGFVMKAAFLHYKEMCEYALKARCRVLFPDYRLAPENPFPAPLLDCLAAFRFAVENAQRLGIDPCRIAFAGDSAGGALAAAAALALRDENSMPAPCFQLLIYPVTDRRMRTDTMREYGDTPMWNSVLAHRMWDWYLGGREPEPPEYASPLEAASFAGLPDAYIETAQFDCLRGEGEEYAFALKKAGAGVELNETEGTMHGFDAAQRSPIVHACMLRRINALERAFAKKGCSAAVLKRQNSKN